MKTKLINIVVIIAGMLFVTSASAQTLKEIQKQQAAIMKEVKKQAKEQAKVYKKAGYIASVGAVPMEKQIETYLLRKRSKELGQKEYVCGQSEATSVSQADARELATTRAKVEIAQSINQKVSNQRKELAKTSQTGNGISGDIKDQREINSVSDKDLDRSEIIIDLYRPVENGTQYLSGVAYEWSRAREILNSMNK